MLQGAREGCWPQLLGGLLCICGGLSMALVGGCHGIKVSLGFTPLALMNHFVKPVAHCEWPSATLWLSSCSGHIIYSYRSNDYMIECGQPVAQDYCKGLVTPLCHSTQPLQHLLQLNDHRRRLYTCLCVFPVSEWTCDSCIWTNDTSALRRRLWPKPLQHPLLPSLPSAIILL